jgi:hypothetical protein
MEFADLWDSALGSQMRKIKRARKSKLFALAEDTMRDCLEIAASILLTVHSISVHDSAFGVSSRAFSLLGHRYSLVFKINLRPRFPLRLCDLLLFCRDIARLGQI